MKTSLYILIGIISTINCTPTAKQAAEKDSELKKILELEKEKSDVYKRIKEAIEDTIATLEKSNDSDARQGISYMRELQLQIAEFNGTELIIEDPLTRNSTENMDDLQELGEAINDNSTLVQSGRRRGKQELTGYEKIKEAIMKFGSLTAMTGKVESKKKKVRLENAIQLQKKLDAWMEQKNAEKARIREYKARLQRDRVVVATESCPDFGEEPGKGGRRRLVKVPCCRKCCKKSYMGCLK